MGAKVVKSKSKPTSISSTNVRSLLKKTPSKEPIIVRTKKSSNYILPKINSSFSAENETLTPKKAVLSRFGGKKSGFNTDGIKALETSELDVLDIIRMNNLGYEDYDLIDNCLFRHFFMRSLDKEPRGEIIKGMMLAQIEANKILFRQGSLGNYFYIVKEGALGLFINNTQTKTFTKGESFGELALLHGASRSGTVKSKTACQLWLLERKHFRKVMEHINQANYEENIRFINSIPILSSLDDDIKSVFASSLVKEFYEEGNHILRGIFILIF
jgi:hypothetical protein